MGWGGNIKYKKKLVNTSINMIERKKTVVRSVSIRKDQDKWARDNYINLSRFVQSKIDEVMEKKNVQK